MKKFISILSVLCLSCLAYAQDSDAYSNFVSRISGARVKFAYSYSTGFETKLTGKGTAVVQGECFCLNGDGVEILCDGKTAYTMDRAAKEVIVESLELEQGDYVNPAMLVSTIEKLFKCKSQSPCNYAGHDALKLILEPRRQCNLARIMLYTSKDGSTLYGASVSMDDGSSSDFFIPSFTVLPAGSLDDFRVDMNALDKGWMITDLR